VNWDDEPQDLAVRLAELGINGSAFVAYDVWQDVALPNLRDRLAATIPPRSALVVAIRPALARPQVVGTTRHLIQGSVDLADETWEPATRTLHATSRNLDGRAYTVTIAVPAGLRAVDCTTTQPCTLTRLPTGHVTLQWEAGERDDLRWSVRFRPGATGRSGRRP